MIASETLTVRDLGDRTLTVTVRLSTMLQWRMRLALWCMALAAFFLRWQFRVHPEA